MNLTLLLQTDPNQVGAERLYSHLFRSNCPVTGQPDWATVVIKYEAPVNDFSLSRYWRTWSRTETTRASMRLVSSEFMKTYLAA